MIDLYYWTTPNGHKMTMFFEETLIPHRRHAVNLQKNEQAAPEFLKISPNGKIPAIIDRNPLGGGAPVSLFESGAILQYLAEKSEELLPNDLRGRLEVLQWLYWQVSGFSPIAGQQVFFRRADQQIAFAIDRFTRETTRLYGVLDQRLADRPYLAGETFSIADISAYPWAAHYDMLHQNIDRLPNVERWLDLISQRPATQRAYAIAKDTNPDAPMPPAPRRH